MKEFNCANQYLLISGNTPLHTAYHTTHRDIANMLIKLGANPNARNLSGLRPQDLGRKR